MDKLLYDMLVKASEEVYKNDKYLINHKASERCIVFRFGYYLQNLMNERNEFHSYNLDEEYNRHFDDPKRMYAEDIGVYPDIIIHKRGDNHNNLLVIECKTWWNSDINNDVKKLKEFTAKSGDYKYKFGVSLIFNKQGVDFKFIENGKEVKNKEKELKNY